MSGHSKWAQIKRQKGVTDAKRGKVFTKHAKLIAIAARKGGDPKMNPSLRTAIDKARADNMPMANIERAVKRGSGEDKDAAQIEAVSYEGYGPGGVAILVKGLTDNKNRTVSEVRLAFTKHGGSMGDGGAVGWLFEERGVIAVKGGGEQVELAAIDAGALDLEQSGEVTMVYTAREDLGRVRDALEKSGCAVESADLSMIAKESMKITDEASAQNVLKLLEELEEHEDIVGVYSNFDVDTGMLQKLSGK